MLISLQKPFSWTRKQLLAEHFLVATSNVCPLAIAEFFSQNIGIWLLANHSLETTLIVFIYFSCRQYRRHTEIVLLKANSKTTVECGKAFDDFHLWRPFPDGNVNVYSVSYDRFNACNVTGGKLLGSINCSSNNQTLDFPNKDGETYYLLGE